MFNWSNYFFVSLLLSISFRIFTSPSPTLFTPIHSFCSCLASLISVNCFKVISIFRPLLPLVSSFIFIIWLLWRSQSAAYLLLLTGVSTHGARPTVSLWRFLLLWAYKLSERGNVEEVRAESSKSEGERKREEKFSCRNTVAAINNIVITGRVNCALRWSLSSISACADVKVLKLDCSRTRHLYTLQRVWSLDASTFMRKI